MSFQVIDAEQRAAALDPEQSFIVQAPAGSGKTELLTQRTLALLAKVQAPEEVIAITFTRKAAAEMRERILKALHRAASAEKPGPGPAKTTQDLAGQVLAQSKKLGWDLESSPARLRIQTIDSLCSGLVYCMPLLSRLGGQGRISEHPEELYLQAAQAAVAELKNDSPWSFSIQTLLRHLDNDMDKACRLIAGMLPKREQWLRHLADPGNRQVQRPRLEQALDQAVQESLREVRELVLNQEARKLLDLVRFAASNLPEPDRQPMFCRLAQLADLPQQTSQDLPLWQGLAEFCLTKNGEFRKRADKNLGFPAPSSSKDQQTKALFQEKKEEFAACMQALSSVPGLKKKLHEVCFLPQPEYTREQWTVLEALFDVLRLAVAHLHLVFQDQAKIDFAEISSRAQLALGSWLEPTDLALILDRRIQHLLIDEFQDTSISQFLLLQTLTAGWAPGDGRTFFAVGDPMQSIYSFREAEVGLFLQARQSGLGHIPLTVLTLSVNFRSQSGIVHWLNQTFPQVLPSAEEPLTGSVPYARADAFHSQTKARAVSIHPFWDARYGPEAQTVISLILQAREENPQGTVAVLVRSRLHLQAIMPALRRAGLHFQALDIDALSQRPVIQDLCSLAKALQHPGHNLAWLAVLRAPWCGLGLEDLDILTGDKHHFLVLSRLLDEEVVCRLSAQGQERLRRVRLILENALQQRQRTGLRRQIESCWQALGGPDCLQSESEGQDAEVFFQLLQNQFASAPHELVDKLDQALISLFARPETQADQSLQLMTIHRAKGLQFDTVILPGLGRSTRPDEHQLLVWLERSRSDGHSELLMAPRTETGKETDPIYAYIQRLIRHKVQHEDGRLLYVAATRARKHLHILGHCNLNEQGQVRQPETNSLLASLWPAVQEEFEQAAKTGAEKSPDLQQTQKESAQAAPKQTLYRLKPGWQAPQLPSGLKPAAGRDSIPDQEDIIFDWAGEIVRCVGTCVHGWLLVLAREGLQAWGREKVHSLRQVFSRQLLELGLLEKELEKGVALVQEALENTLQDRLGRWILAPHRQAKNEYALSGLVKGQVTSVVMDRSFVDEQGLRWIIDYKTSRHTGTDLQGFLDQEQARYQGQMEIYARLMQAREQRPIRLGLYFPLLSGWRNWTWPA